MRALHASAVAASFLLLSACGTSSRGYATGPALSEAVVATGSGSAGRADVERAGLDEGAPDRKLVRDAMLDIEVGSDGKVTSALAEAHAVTEALDGYVAWEGPGEMILRIPDSRLDQALDRLAALGDEERREVRVRDVTAAYTDLDVRLTNARALQTRLRALLGEADTVADVLAVERELARVTTEVDLLEGQMRLLQNQVAYSTVRLRVYDDVQPGPLGWVFVGLYEAVKWLFVWD